MIILNSIEDLKLNNTIVMTGKFDGLHLGHQKLLDRAVELKETHRSDDLKLVLFTFSILPASFESHEPERRIVTSDEIQSARLNPQIDYFIECPFTYEIKNLTPEDFAKKILIDKLCAKYVIAGDDFRFGINRSGDADILCKLGMQLGFNAEIIKKITYHGREISSTYIREMISTGNMEAAYAMMGKPYFITSRVLEGKKLGKKIGFPTINFMIPENKIVPAEGVYATRTVINHKLYMSITNIGSQPTFHLSQSNYAETHILDFDGDLYGAEAKVKFYKFIRPVQKFDSVSSLADEIRRNIDFVREYFSNLKITENED